MTKKDRTAVLIMLGSIVVIVLSIAWALRYPSSDPRPAVPDTRTTTTSTTEYLGGIECGPARVDLATAKKIGCAP
jgi:hypothetical protein